ncbi:hypothetical protein J4G02_11345 [Candidatus Poribacteria bacterium]|nr:hypothetical protein [Candidatus Poribacteria bacterium]
MTPVRAVDELQHLIEETFLLIESEFPAIDIEGAREKFRSERRRAWNEPPKGIFS